MENKNRKLHLTTNQINGIQAILATDTMEKAAEKAGVTRNTLYRWVKEDLFARELNLARRQLVRYGVMKLQQATRDAVKTLLAICRDKDAPASSRVSAAKEILNNTLKSIELEDIEDRLNALEEKNLK